MPVVMKYSVTLQQLQRSIVVVVVVAIIAVMRFDYFKNYYYLSKLIGTAE